MMSTNQSVAEAGGFPEHQQQQPADNWWLSKWSSWLASIGACVLGVFGLLAVAFNLITLSVGSAIAGALQVCAAAIILAIEGSAVVSFLTFAKPIGMFFAGRPLYIKTAVYAGLTIIPMLFGTSSSIAVLLGFLVSAGITSIYGMILIGRKGNIDDMRAAAEQPKF